MLLRRAQSRQTPEPGVASMVPGMPPSAERAMTWVRPLPGSSWALGGPAAVKEATAVQVAGNAPAASWRLVTMVPLVARAKTWSLLPG